MKLYHVYREVTTLLDAKSGVVPPDLDDPVGALRAWWSAAPP